MIKIWSPTRVDIAGGTLDLWPINAILGNASTINVAIDIKTHAELEGQKTPAIRIESPDLKKTFEFKNLEELFSSKDKDVSLYQSFLKFWQPKEGFYLKTSSESPVGGGLGGSSSLTVTMMKAFGEWLGPRWNSVHELVHICHNIEAQVLSTPTGTQDYYPAVTGGLSVIKYSWQGIGQEVFSPPSRGFKDHLILVYTGRTHHSGLNNFEVLKGVVSKDEKIISALKGLNKVATAVEALVQNNKWQELPPLLEEELKYRLQLTPAFTSPEIEKLRELALQVGSTTLKICGAGGGGCVALWTDPAKHETVKKECQKQGFQVLPVSTVDPL